MYTPQCVLVLLALYVGLAHSFSWDIVVTRDDQLEFYYDGTLTYSVPTNHFNNWITYDPLHNRVLFSNTYSYNHPDIFSFDIASGKIQSLIKKKSEIYIKRLAYDPATELLFMTIDQIMYSFSLKPGSKSEANGNLVINFQNDLYPREIVVDSCGGYIYWTPYYDSNVVERVRFNGSEREVIIDNNNENNGTMIRKGLTIDPQTQSIYWIEHDNNNDDEFSIKSADLNGKNARTLHREIRKKSVPDQLTISKDFIYWGDNYYSFFWQLPKNPPRDTYLKPKQILMDKTTYCWGFQGIATNYKINERTQGVQNCNALKRLLPN